MKMVVKKKNRFEDWKYPNIKEGELTKYNWMVQNVGGLNLGVNIDIGAFSYINALHGITIEDKVQIGSHCSIYSISTIDNIAGRVILKENCKIGAHSTILPGVTVGKNSIIGAHSLVKNDIPDNVIAFGVPAKAIRVLKDVE
jgi:acetyltransferase-like isoleucine patch superfamily enzyme